MHRRSVSVYLGPFYVPTPDGDGDARRVRRLDGGDHDRRRGGYWSGVGPSLSNYSNYWLGLVPSALRGRAAGMLTMAFFAGQFVSPLLAAPLVGVLGLAGTFDALAFAQLALAGVIGLLAVRERRATIV